MGAFLDNNKTVPLTAEQKQRWLDAIAKMDDTFLPNLAWQGEGTEHKYVYVASFDGTWNDRDNIRPGEAATNPAVLEAELSKHYDGHLAGNYYNGVGTRENAIMRVIDGMTGNGSEERAEHAFKDFQKQAQDWIKADPDAQIQVFTMGFSRGSASARHFLNLVDQRGVPADDGHRYVEDPSYLESALDSKVVQTYDKFLREPGSVPSSALLYDTVATGQEGVLKLGLPASTRFVVHLTSIDEERRAFPLIAIDSRSPDSSDSSRFLSIALPGVHSDIGGGYQEGVGKLGRYMGEQVLYRFGFDVEPGAFPKEALEEGRHRHFIDAGSLAELAEMGTHEPPVADHRRTKYVENENLSEVQKAELTYENREAELAAAVRYVENLGKGVAPKDPLGYENLGIALTPHKDGTMDVLLSNPKAMQFDEQTGAISVYGKVVHTLSDADYTQLKGGDPVVEVFSILPEHSLAAAQASDKPPVLGDIPKVGQPSSAVAASDAAMPAAVPSM